MFKLFYMNSLYRKTYNINNYEILNFRFLPFFDNILLAIYSHTTNSIWTNLWIGTKITYSSFLRSFVYIFLLISGVDSKASNKIVLETLNGVTNLNKKVIFTYNFFPLPYHIYSFKVHQGIKYNKSKVIFI